MQNPEGLIDAIKAESIWLVAGVGLLCLLYFVVLRVTAKANVKTA
jgi:hypothetical protein